MEGGMYYGSLAFIVIASFTMYQTNRTLMMGIFLVIGVYIVYVHETGNTATKFKNSTVDSLNSSTDDWKPNYEIEEERREAEKNALKDVGQKHYSKDYSTTSKIQKENTEEDVGGWTPDYDPNQK